MNTNNIKYPNNKLKEIRKERNLFQKDVARVLEMKCEDRLCRWEKGLSAPSITNLARLAKLYQVLPHELYPELFADPQAVSSLPGSNQQIH